MKGDYFSLEIVSSMLGGIQKHFKNNKGRAYYKLKNGDLVVIRNNALSPKSKYYWYNVQRDLFDSDVRYVVCVAGFEGIYSIPIELISNYVKAGLISHEKDGFNYKLLLKRVSENMYLHLTGSAEPVLIEQYQIYHQFYEKTNEIGPEQAVTLNEGAKKAVFVNAYERNSLARQKCIEHYGAKCQICGFDFAKVYGNEFEGLIEVHHIKPISTIKSEYVVDPIKDLIPLCPNCHTAIHKIVDNRYLSVEELKKRILLKP